LLGRCTIVEPKNAKSCDLCAFHDKEYIEAIQKADPYSYPTPAVLPTQPAPAVRGKRRRPDEKAEDDQKPSFDFDDSDDEGGSSLLPPPKLASVERPAPPVADSMSGGGGESQAGSGRGRDGRAREIDSMSQGGFVGWEPGEAPTEDDPSHGVEVELPLSGDPFGLHDDCPAFPGLFGYCCASAGGVLTACETLTSGRAEIAVVWSGTGRHHAKKSTGACAPSV